MKKSTTLSLILILALFVISWSFYPQLPQKMASHWDAKGQVNGYMGKFGGTFLLPIITVFVFLLLHFIPVIDPLRKNIHKFRNYYDGFILLFVAFMTYLQALILAANLGVKLNLTTMLMPAFAVFFYFIGVVLKNAKRNWIMGIRTPWTLSSDKVWEKTNKLGGQMFQWTGVLVLIGTFFGEYGLWLMVAAVLFSSLYAVIYSYFAYRSIK